MNVERTEVERRAAVHAALGDPARLRIVDALSLGDRSPVELQAELGMPSNLMAHHLKTLEGAGLISRHRSEADRRRSYLTLERAGLVGLLPGALLTAPRVVFVCTANTARSHLAAALWRTRSAIPSTSAGTHPGEKIARGALDAAHRHGLELPEVAPQALAEVAQPGDLVITVCDLAHEELAEPHALHLSIPDPVALGTRKAFDDAFELLAERVEDLAPRIAAA
ncbi:ArsR family transcriptional regulator [Gryllotalpicola protaetiae]|uniref:ArsR family transcriptional regulator n=2 Tax=Gryllotalpicola protaetiae TaxID=2419771 RepID=A0A387BHF4_9MICO|nr:helix-turn-helix domain-containing protein [Gryllotalpicola protaetiae]AYG03465.1 ArsR family transcriptional regulator [Gryllotalpicola protaetiae]